MTAQTFIEELNIVAKNGKTLAERWSGDKSPVFFEDEVEKNNPYHDPKTGRFTNKPGGSSVPRAKDGTLLDKNGKPLVLYHGTGTGGFTEFDSTKGNKSGKNDHGSNWFTESKSVASTYVPGSRKLTPDERKTALKQELPKDVKAFVRYNSNPKDGIQFLEIGKDGKPTGYGIKTPKSPGYGDTLEKVDIPEKKRIHSKDAEFVTSFCTNGKINSRDQIGNSIYASHAKEDHKVKNAYQMAQLRYYSNNHVQNEGSEIKQVNLKMKNPLVVDFKGKGHHDVIEHDGKTFGKYTGYTDTSVSGITALERYARANGYDGLIAQNVIDTGGRRTLNGEKQRTSTSYAVFSNDNIKIVGSEVIKSARYDEIVEVEKFNPYHDRLGRFASSNSATSFTYKPGKSTEHSKAIEREKERNEQTSKGFKGTLYHGSPAKDIEEFDMSRAGKNTSSGEKLLYFTDSKQMAEDFSYERLDGSSKFFQRRGEKGRVYEVEVEIKNPLDLRNLSDKDVDNLLKLDVDGLLTKDLVQSLSSNHQLLKASLDLRAERLKELGYDGMIANTGKTGHNSLEYAVVDSKQAKIKKSDMESEEMEQKEFSIYKADDDKRLVFGWASISITADGEQLEDRQKDMIDPEDLEEAAYNYVLHFRDTGEEHIPTMRKKGKLVESCVFTAEKQKAMGIPEGTLPIGWWIGFKIEDDDAWERVKNGTYKMFSIEGRANREPVEKTAPVAKTFDEILQIEKFNPYHDRLGRFATANGATSFTYSPGKSKAHDNAIAREKERQATIDATKPKAKTKNQTEGRAKEKSEKKPKNFREAQDYAVKKLGFSYVDYTSVDLETANHINDTVAKIQQRFPELKGTVIAIEPITSGNSVAEMSLDVDLSPNGVPRQFLGYGMEYQSGLKWVKEMNKKDTQLGFHPKGVEDVSSVIWHEYGHAYANLQSGKKIAAKEPGWNMKNAFRKARSNNELEGEWIAKAAKSRKMTPDEFKKSISRYATFSDGEAFAEAFSEFFVSPNPRPECVALMKAAGII